MTVRITANKLDELADQIMTTVTGYLLGKAFQGFAALLYPQQQIVENGFAVGGHIVEVVEVFGGEQVGHSRDDHGGVGSLGVAK
jgi:hypothetical protein